MDNDNNRPDFLIPKFQDGFDWQVLHHDDENWCTGISSPPQSSIDEIVQLEKHDGPEFFMLTKGRANILVRDEEEERVIELKPFQPVVVNGWHHTYCPDGPRTGSILVVEKPNAKTEIKNRVEFVN